MLLPVAAVGTSGYLLYRWLTGHKSSSIQGPPPQTQPPVPPGYAPPVAGKVPAYVQQYTSQAAQQQAAAVALGILNDAQARFAKQAADKAAADKAAAVAAANRMLAMVRGAPPKPGASINSAALVKPGSVVPPKPPSTGASAATSASAALTGGFNFNIR